MPSRSRGGDTVVVLVTAPTPDAAAEIARALVAERIVACGNVVPGLRSVYRWQGKVQDEPEALLVLKTKRRLLGALKARLPGLHPYQVPELLALRVADGLAAYLDWVEESVRAPDPGPRSQPRARARAGRAGAPRRRRRKAARVSARRP